jgi:hypothetical protein
MSGRARKTFRLDAEAYVDYYFAVFLRQVALGGCALLPCAPCERSNLRDYAEAVTVSVTSTHVVYTKERTKTCWRLPPCDAGKVVQQIPLRQVTDVVVSEPAGGCCPAERLVRVTVQTAGSDAAEMHLVGMFEKDAYELRRLLTSSVAPAVMRR